MQTGKFNILLDAMWGSSGKGKVSAWLADKFCVNNVSSSNFPNAGHTFQNGDYKFVAKTLPTALALKQAKSLNIMGWLSPASGITVTDSYHWARLVAEWVQTGKPNVVIHSRASIVTPGHAETEKIGPGSTKHIASTMQGCSAAMVEKILRKESVLLAGSRSVEEWTGTEVDLEEFASHVRILDGAHFRFSVQQLIQQGNTWLHEGSQGYALSIDHGSNYPHCLSGESRVMMSGGPHRTMKIRNVTVGMTVLSKTEDGRIIPRKVVNVWKNPTGSKKWFNIVTETSVYNLHDQQWIGPKLTGDHKIQTIRGEVAVKDLVRGDQVFTQEYELVEDGLQTFLGSLLGDGTIQACKKNKRRATLQISHGASQRGYALAKASIMRSYMEGSDRIIRYGASSFKEGNEQIRYQSSTSIVVKRLATRLGCYGVKNPDMRAIVDMIDERGLAIWYQDDGRLKNSVNGPEVILYTNGFSENSCKELVEALFAKFSLNFTINKVRGSRETDETNRKEYPTLRLSRKDHGKWFSMISKYVHDDLSYKLPDGFHGEWTKNWNRIGELRCATETVLDVTPSRDFRGMKLCYDIEVEGTHNFFVKNDKGAFNVENCTSRNCTVQKAMDDMAVPAKDVGDVYLNLRTHPIRVGNVEENGVQLGYSGDFYSDCKEMSWEQVAEEAGMPSSEVQSLMERERTTVTKRVRRVCSFSWEGLEDAVASNGATKLSLNFVQYLDWNDRGLRGERKAFNRLSSKTRAFIDKIEQVANLSVVLIGTGADHEAMISLL